MPKQSKQHEAYSEATPNHAKFSQLTRPEKITKKPEKLEGSEPFNAVQVSLISKDGKSGHASEKMLSDGPHGGCDGVVDFIKFATAMELRRRFKAEATAHRNMLARAKNGKVVRPSFRSFRDFLLYVRPMPGKSMTLDRIDNDDPEYAPGKVRWADRHTQNNNKSDTLTFYCSRTGDVYTTSLLSKLQNVSPDAIRKRRGRGWTDDQIIEGKRVSSAPKLTKGATGAVTLATKFPAGLYTPTQLALLSRSEKQLISASDIMFHRDAHYQQWARLAEFLMRCLFTMFAEDVKLIPEKGFQKLLGQMKDTPDNFVPALESLWMVMDGGGYAPHLNATLKKFNGSLFKKRAALPLDRDDINELWIAAGKDWSDVEPAIFGTLLERALNARERSKLGAHYTPRAYVERLVVPTIIEPLRADWELVQGQVKELRDKGDNAGALAAVKAYHHKLCTTRVLDPACGTGNFLYVSLELMKRLEGEVLEALDDLGEDQARFAMEGETVNPRQFYGLELNPRAVPIADLVLWIGYLKWQLKTAGLASITEPILHAYGTIKQQDAVIAYDREELQKDASGKPLARWDGVTKKLHPITGEEIPDPDAQVTFYNYVNPKRAPWPEVEFIVGNPPFIGGKDMRAELGDGYAEACWAVRSHISGGADFVMHFWDEAATRLVAKPAKGQTNPLRRFGFITTNSITQTFSRRVIERHMTAKEPVSLVFAVPNHPWMKATDKAAVRIAMTVVEKGEHDGVLAEVTSEFGLSTDTPQIGLYKRKGKISARITLGAHLSSAKPLISTAELSSRGVMLFGGGFIVSKTEAANLGLGRVSGTDQLIKPYLNGRDMAGRTRDLMVIDLYPYQIEAIQRDFPAVFQHVLERVKPERDQNRDIFIRDRWWQFGRVRTELRDFLNGLTRFIATVETTRHRFFQFLDTSIRPDNKIVAIGLSAGEHLAVLSSRLHVTWSIAKGGWMGVGNDPVYAKSETFDPFPFPLAVDPMLASGDPLYAQRERLRELGGRLDTLRKQRLAQHPFLTMTGLYNALERLRELENGCDVPPLTDAERDVHQAGLISVLKELHDDIDRTVLAAYGWDDLIPELVGKPGATLPSMHKMERQEQAEEELLARLVAFNQERAAEEKRGLVRWLRPDYQTTKLGVKAPKFEGEHVGVLDVDLPVTVERLKWPSDGLEQIRLVRDLLAKAPAPTPPDTLTGIFDGRNTVKRRDRVAEVLETLVATGVARTGDVDGQRRYFLPR